jgi:hypothetical protein
MRNEINSYLPVAPQHTSLASRTSTLGLSEFSTSSVSSKIRCTTLTPLIPLPITTISTCRGKSLVVLWPRSLGSVCQNEAEDSFEGRPAGVDIVEGVVEGLECVVSERRSMYCDWSELRGSGDKIARCVKQGDPGRVVSSTCLHFCSRPIDSYPCPYLVQELNVALYVVSMRGSYYRMNHKMEGMYLGSPRLSSSSFRSAVLCE